MGIFYSTYYGLTRLSGMGPEAKGWSATDLNFEVISLVLNRTGESHIHSGATPLAYPGYNSATPATPLVPNLTVHSSNGSIPGGTTVNIRLSFLDSSGLETLSGPDTYLTLPPGAARPSKPGLISDPIATPVTGALTGGTYLYALTKGKGAAGETEISDITFVDVPYVTLGAFSQSTYTVPLSFDPIRLYSDGTDRVYLYRSTGFASNFQLVKTFYATPDGSVGTYLDDSSMQDRGKAPPTVNTFSRSNKVRIDWGKLATPPEAETLRVYVSQEAGIWGVNHLLQEYDLKDLATPVPYFLDYDGSETLNFGWPKEVNQIPAGPSKIHLNTQTYGGPILTDKWDARGYQALNFRLGTPIPAAPLASGGLSPSTLPDGIMYYDPSIPSGRMRVGGVWVNFATPGGTSGYVHPAQEGGGHLAQNIVYGTKTVKDVADLIASSTGQFRKSATKVYKDKISATFSTVAYQSPQYIQWHGGGAGGLLLNTLPEFGGQWLEVSFNARLYSYGAYGIAVGIVVDGVLINESVRYDDYLGSGASVTMSTEFATPVSKSLVPVGVQMWSARGAVVTVGDAGSIIAKLLL